MIVKINLIPVTFQMINSGDPCYIASIKFKNLKKILAFLNIVCCVLLHYILCQCLNVTLFECMTKPSRIFSPLEQLWHLKSGKWVKSVEFWNCNFDYVINANFMGLTIQRTFLHSILPQKGSVWLVHLELHPCESSICYWNLEESFFQTYSSSSRGFFVTSHWFLLADLTVSSSLSMNILNYA